AARADGRLTIGAPERGGDRPVVSDHERLPRDPASHRVVPTPVLSAESGGDGPEPHEQLPVVIRVATLHTDTTQKRANTHPRRPIRDMELPPHVRPRLAHLVARIRVDVVVLVGGKVV